MVGDSFGCYWFSSPSRGSYISTGSWYDECNGKSLVLVPFPGFLYLYLSVPTTKQELEFSSPSRGSYISTLLTLNKTIHGFSSRPLPGVLISLHNKDSCYQALADRFSSPSRGSYISTKWLATCNEHWKRSRPLPGVLISLHEKGFTDWFDYARSRPLPGVLISLRCM